jgi:hypothetical protein
MPDVIGFGSVTALPALWPVNIGRFGKQDFIYLSDEDVYRCTAGEKLKYYYTNEENGQKLRRYWTNACRHCALEHRCTTGVQRRITRWDHEHVVEAVQKRLDENPQAMRQRRETVESVRHDESAHGRDPLPNETYAEGRNRDGAARARQQSHARDEHRGRQAVDRGDEGLRRPRVARAAGSLSAPSRRILGRAPDLLQDRDRKNMLETVVVRAPARSRLADTPSRALSRSQDPFQTFDVTASRIFVPDELS